MPIIGIGGTHSGHTRGATQINLRSIYLPEQSLQTTAHILTRLTAQLPSLPRQQWQHLQDVQLSDPQFLTPGTVDIILGADSYGLLIEPDVIKGNDKSPVAQKTIFGWIILGQVVCTASINGTVHQVSVDNSLHDLLSQFWVQEEVPTRSVPAPTPEEAECEAHFLSTHSRDSSGRYIVRLPLKLSTNSLGDSRLTATRCLQQLLRQFSTNEEYRQLYSAFIKEYEDLRHMRRILCSPPEQSQVCYLPHHSVLKEQSLTTKQRVVFNGSSRSTSGNSLNDVLHIGAKLQLDISDVLLWLRRHRYVFATDITKMFRQIKVHQDDWDLQRILWIDDQQNIVPYQLTSVTYGTRCAPFLAIRVLLQLVKDEVHKYPLAVTSLLKGRYVDDIFGGSDNLSETVISARQLISLCTVGGFPLQKWTSNHPDLLGEISPTDMSSESTLVIEDSSVKILGLIWNTTTDNFQFSNNSRSPKLITKRSILSEVAQLFDPLGFIAPVIIVAMVLLQDLWLIKLSWDDSLPPRIRDKWLQFREDLTELSKINILRWLHLTKPSRVELHGFSDSSQLAMAAVIYLRITDNDGCKSKISFVCAKTKVAPLKRLTIPRLELSAAVLLSKLISYVTRTLDLHEVSTHLWTDSSVALTWIHSHPSRWKEFVQNRVLKIHEIIPHGTWRYVPGKENPADCASRGLTPTQLVHHQLWWKGPPWLNQSSNRWPSLNYQPNLDANLEERPGLTLTASTSPVKIWDLLNRYSTLTRLL